LAWIGEAKLEALASTSNEASKRHIKLSPFWKNIFHLICCGSTLEKSTNIIVLNPNS